jgi:NTE family protein
MRALVLSGGGAKGAYQVGVLKRWIFEEKRQYDIVCGISVGALNAAALCQSKSTDFEESYEYLSGVWDRVENRKIRKWWFGWYLAALWKSSVYDSTPLEEWVHEELDHTKIESSGRRLRVGAVNWNTGEYFVANENTPSLDKWVSASASYPGFFKPVKIDGDEWTDGGVRNVTPLGDAIKAGAHEIDVITVSNLDIPNHAWKPRFKSSVFYATRALDLAVDEVMKGDIKECGLKNEIAFLNDKYKHIKVNIQQPSKNFDINPLDFDPKIIKELRDFGYKDSL